MFNKDRKQASLGLALSGGFALGFAHIGVLRALQENDISVSVIAGTSSGSIIAACHAFGMSLEVLEKISEQLSWRKISNLTASRLGLSSNRALGALLKRYLGDADIEDAQVPLAVVATDITTGEKIILRSGNLSDAIRASCSVPGFYSPVELDGRLLVDGALVENVPYSAIQQMGCDISIGVNLFGHMQMFRPRNIFEVLNLSTNILSSHRDTQLHEKFDILIEPFLEHYNPTRFKNSKKIIEEGYKATIEHMPRIREIIQRSERNYSYMNRIRDFFGY